MLALRWTIGDVRTRGFAALQASITGARRLFGAGARYRVYVNSIDVDEARRRTGDVPEEVEWLEAPRVVPECLSRALDPRMAEGVAWKLLPLHAFPDDHELSLDNDVILWDVPRAIREWLDGKTDFVLAADVRASFGKFAPLCGERPLNSGIRGVPPGFALEKAFEEILRAHSGLLVSELDEQGLQCAVVLASGKVGVIELDEVTICSPFPPHLEHLGNAGAHFVGLNTRVLGFQFNGRPAEDVRAAHWDALSGEINRRIRNGGTLGSPESKR
ncbi:MAG: hypothetical protein JWP01_3303 [Myxococcales bacterium]|nr:hypothetical protein [Myxococcales bacterium]